MEWYGYGTLVRYASKIELKYGTQVRYGLRCEVRSTQILNVPYRTASAIIAHRLITIVVRAMTQSELNTRHNIKVFKQLMLTMKKLHLIHNSIIYFLTFWVEDKLKISALINRSFLGAVHNYSGIDPIN